MAMPHVVLTWKESERERESRKGRTEERGRRKKESGKNEIRELALLASAHSQQLKK